MLTEISKNKYFKKKLHINYNGRLVSLEKPLVMGVLNMTTDSFYDGGKYCFLPAAMGRAIEIVKQGGNMIDIGAFSTRPGADEIPVKVEIDRLIPVVKEIKQRFPDILISIDTFRAKVAATVIESCGPCIINDISGGLFDNKMVDVVADLQVPYIAMHLQGNLQNMHEPFSYTNITKEVIKHLSERVELFHSKGICDVILDPGFGFSKNMDQNYELFNHLDAFRFFELPVLVGISRKSMIYKLLDSNAQNALNGTTVMNTLALIGGADILRVHDVKEAVELVSIFDKLKQFVQ